MVWPIKARPPSIAGHPTPHPQASQRGDKIVAKKNMSYGAIPVSDLSLNPLIAGPADCLTCSARARGEESGAVEDLSIQDDRMDTGDVGNVL